MLFNYRLLSRQYCASLRPGTRTTLRLGGRRIRFLTLFAILYPILWLTSVLGLCLDNIFYPGHRATPARYPVFIVGNFRTGSTFLFRLLSRDPRSFSSMRTWEIYFAPSVLQRRFWTGVFAVDRFLGSPILRAIREGQERVLGDVQLHRIRLDEPEEDEALFCLPWHTLFTCFFFPMELPGFPYPRFDQALPGGTRRRLLEFYEGCVRRHLYAHRSRAHYLSKNPSATSRMASLMERFPDARFICLYRDPVETVPSTMRWFSYAWHYFSSAPERYPLGEFIQRMVEHWYEYPLRLAQGQAANRIHFVSYEDLVLDPQRTVERIYACLGLTPDARFREIVRQEAELARDHKPDGMGDLADTGLTRDAIVRRYRGAMEAYRRLFAASPHPPARPD